MRAKWSVPAVMTAWRFAIAGLTGLVLIAASCNRSTGPERAPNGSLRVLFIGNSLTYTHQLPAVLEAIADSAGGRRIHSGAVTFGGVSLEDHWRLGDALEAIDSRQWDIVVLQQGPSSLDANRAQLIHWTGLFAARIRAAGAQPALYQVWPDESRLDFFDRVLDSYRLAAESVNGELLPVGSAWLAAWERDSMLPLYGPDRFHPSPMAVYLAAITIYGELMDAAVSGLPAIVSIGGSGTPIVSLGLADAANLQAAADEVTGAAVDPE